MERPNPGHNICVMCSKPTALICSICRSRIYCSKECQKADWRVHKQLCSKLHDFGDDQRPGDNYVRAMIFEAKQPVVKFVWVRVETIFLNGKPYYDKPITDGLFPPEEMKGFTTELYPNNSIRGRRLTEIIHVKFPGSFFIDDSPVNETLAKLTPSSVERGRAWRGPLLAIRQKNSYIQRERPIYGFINDSPGYSDMGMAELRDVVDYVTLFSMGQS